MLTLQVKRSWMYNITLICTRHSEIGECNINALYKIIERIEPDLIFEEKKIKEMLIPYGKFIKEDKFRFFYIARRASISMAE